MNHLSDCDCGPCGGRPGVKMPPSKVVRIEPESRRREIAWKRHKKHEEKILNELMTHQGFPILSDHNGDPSSTDQTLNDQIQTLFMETLRHYKENGKWFSEAEVRIAFRVWQFFRSKKGSMPIGLCGFLCAVLWPSIQQMIRPPNKRSRDFLIQRRRNQQIHYSA